MFYLTLARIFSIVLSIYYTECALDFSYHNHVQYSSLLKDYANRYPAKTHLYSIGQSVEGRDLWAIAIADSQPNIHVPLRPEAKYVGNMHGNEVASKEILLHFIDYLLMNQTSDPDVDFLLKNTRIHILPSMNPDGYELAVVGDCYSVQGRWNKNNRDLNRNFPDLFKCNNDVVQPETRAIMNWLKNNDFILSANFHGGAVVANYPYDNTANGLSIESPTNDDDMFRSIAFTYSKSHLTMRNSNCGNNFRDGITNGAAWYAVPGGMQDYNYWGYGCFEITVELTCCKFPVPSELPQIWLDNRRALIDYLKRANTGIRGIVTYWNGQPAENITVKIDSREPYFRTNKNGEFYRILLDGTYTVSFMYNCDEIYSQTVTVNGLNTFNVTLPNDVSQLSGNYIKKRFPLYCAQKITKCDTYNNDDSVMTFIESTGDDSSSVFNNCNLIKSFYLNLFSALILVFIFHYSYQN